MLFSHKKKETLQFKMTRMSPEGMILSDIKVERHRKKNIRWSHRWNIVKHKDTERRVHHRLEVVGHLGDVFTEGYMRSAVRCETSSSILYRMDGYCYLDCAHPDTIDAHVKPSFTFWQFSTPINGSKIVFQSCMIHVKYPWRASSHWSRTLHLDLRVSSILSLVSCLHSNQCTAFSGKLCLEKRDICQLPTHSWVQYCAGQLFCRSKHSIC